MPKSKMTMTARQLTALCAVAMISPATLALPFWASEAHQSGWLILPLCLPLNLLAVSLFGIYQKSPDKPDLSVIDLSVSVFGRALGRTLLFIAGAAAPLALLTCHTRMFAARFTATLFPHASETVFLAALLTLTFFITRGGPARAARMGVILLWTALAVLTLLLICSLGTLKAANLLPISPRDYKSLALAAPAGLSMSGVFLLGGFLSGDVDAGARAALARETRRAVVLMTVFLTAILVLSLGVLGPEMVKRADYPVFTAVKALSFPGVLERLDAFAVTLWMLSDVALAALYFIAAAVTLTKVFGIRRYGRLAAVLHILIAAQAFVKADPAAVRGLMVYTVEPVCLSAVVGFMALLYTVDKIRNWRRQKSLPARNGR